MKTIVCIPTYNEKANIEDLISSIRLEMGGVPLDVLVVDSASPDGTAEKVLELQAKDSSIHLIRQPAKLGLGRAYLEGMEWVLARPYDCLITMDADFSHHPRYLLKMIRYIADYDLVIGSRYVRGGELQNWPLHRKFLSRFANGYAKVLTGMPFCDLTSGFHCFRTVLLRKILNNSIRTEGYAFLVELKFLAVLRGARCVEIPIVFSDRTRGRSKISHRVIYESMCYVGSLLFQRGRIRSALRGAAQASGEGQGPVLV
ncbi:MAG TPA: polyprenol monophosphomannose synthase [Candidatus Omnitrophota bacterium]|nr:polyprenol monophosphomannose synthase [Candidatus Omnitrophota bacterium]